MEWIFFETAVELARKRLNSSIDYARAIAKRAIESGEVHRIGVARPGIPVLLLPDDGIVGMNLTPGAKNPGGVTADGKPLVYKNNPDEWRYNKADYLDWLNRNHPSELEASAEIPHKPDRTVPEPQPRNYAPSKTASPQRLDSLWNEWQQGRDKVKQNDFVAFGRAQGVTNRTALREFYNERRGRPGRGRPRKNAPK